MKTKLCLFAALALSVASLTGCSKVEARIQIKEANEAYNKEDYKTALAHSTTARDIDPKRFPELSRMIGYSRIGLYVPDDKSAENERNADIAAQELRNYLKRKPD